MKQLLSFANLEEPSNEVCDVNDVIERSRTHFSRLVQNDQVLEFQLAEKLPRAYVDPKHLMRIVSSLVSNAREAMDEGGEIEIFTDSIYVDKDSPHFEVPFGRYIRVGVRDQGVGMDRETKRRCFEPFFTTKNVDPSTGLGLSGSGLGLAAAYALARRNGGRLVVDSRPGKGSVFTLYIPADRKLVPKSSESDFAHHADIASLEVERERIGENIPTQARSLTTRLERRRS